MDIHRPFVANPFPNSILRVKFSVSSFPVFFLRAAYAHSLHHLSSSDFLFFFFQARLLSTPQGLALSRTPWV